MYIVTLAIFSLAIASQPPDFEHAQPLLDGEPNTILMHATFQISGAARTKGMSATGTAFVVGRAIPNSDPPWFAYTLVSAKHVLDAIASESANITVRIRNANGSYSAVNMEVPIA